MRLIDADELIMCLEHGVWNSAVEVVKEQPTAYDVEKVMEQVNELWKRPVFDKAELERVIRAGGKE